MIDPNLLQEVGAASQKYSDSAAKVVDDQKLLTKDQAQAQTDADSERTLLQQLQNAITAELSNLPPPAPAPTGN